MFRTIWQRLTRWMKWRGEEHAPVWLADALDLVAWFPVGVTVLCAATFLFGGRCAAWQWWSVLAFALGVEMVRRRNTWRQGLAAGAAFLGGLVGIWLMAGVILTISIYIDNQSYHLPAIRLMTAGWNPVFQSTVETLPGGGAPEAWGLRVWHILALPKGPWMFSAVAWFVFREALALFWPLLALLFLASARSLWRFFGGRAWWVRVVAVMALAGALPGGVSNLVDGVVMMGAVGLLAEMGLALRTGRCRFGAMVPFAFWMMCSKQTSLLICALFLMCFGGLWLWQQRMAWRQTFGRLTLLALGLIGLWALVSVSPYWTAWHHYGHPLYPKMTCDAERFPVRNIVDDFGVMNQDARAMGHFGRLINAYVSEELAAVWYRWRLGQETFAPRQETWFQHGDGGKESGSPTQRRLRVVLVGCVLVVLLLGKRDERALLGVTLASLAAVPSEMIGFLRYVPWHCFIPFLAFEVLTRERRKGALRWVMAAGVLGFVGVTILESIRLCRNIRMGIDERWAVEEVLDNAPPTILYTDDDGLGVADETSASARARFAIVGNPRRTGMTNLQLLQAMEPRLAGAQIVLANSSQEDDDRFPRFLTLEFRMDAATDERLCRARCLLSKDQLRKYGKRKQKRFFAHLEVVFVRMPALLCRRAFRRLSAD